MWGEMFKKCSDSYQPERFWLGQKQSSGARPTVGRTPEHLIRELTLDPSRNYQPISPVYDVADVPRHVSGMS
jgi:hypothetical protein